MSFNRSLWVWLHRWVGLVLAGFLLVAGLTGSVLAFFHELSIWSAPALYRQAEATRALPPLDPFTLRERVQARHSEAWINYVVLTAPEPGLNVVLSVEPRPDPKTGVAPELPYDELFVDPATGAEVARRTWGDLGQGLHNLLPFLYRLHYSLALGIVGTYAFGVIALLWTIDCFVGAWLTLPARAKARHGGRAPATRGWWSRWAPAWRLRWAAGAYKLNFDLHRAGGLWLWAMLFVLAWSSVAFNLSEVYKPVMRALMPLEDPYDRLQDHKTRLAEPGLDWREAHARARVLMAEFTAREGINVRHEESLSLDRGHHAWRYYVMSDRDIRDKYGSTAVFFDAHTGALLAEHAPTGQHAGNTVTTWLLALHMATVWGLPFRIFVCVMGLVVAMLSITGIVIWLKKRGAQRRAGIRTLSVSLTSSTSS